MRGRETDGFDLVELEGLHEVHLSVLVEPHGYGELALDAGGFILGSERGPSSWARKLLESDESKILRFRDSEIQGFS
jgi:hypothetical protein